MDGWPELQLILDPWFPLPGAEILIIVLAAAVAHLATRRQHSRMAGVAWTLAWVLLFAGITIMHHPPYSLTQSATGAALGTTGAVVTAMLLIPWRERPAHDWRWFRVAWWLGRAVFGVGIACLLMYAMVFYIYVQGW